jgi:hypothetical protein
MLGKKQKVIYTQGSIDYELDGGLGRWAKSKEPRHLEIGDTRVIKGILMKVYSFEVGWLTYKATWAPVDEKINNWENLRKWIGSDE